MGNHLLEFSMMNYRSFKKLNYLSMLATKMTTKDSNVDRNNVIPVEKDYSVLSSAAIYGANASGKSNLIQAMNFMKMLVLYSANDVLAEDLFRVSPYRLSAQTENSPSFFQIVILIDGKKFRYGFEVNQNNIVSEWLFTISKVREVELFTREYQIIKMSRNFKEGKGLDIKTRKNALFLSVVTQFNGNIATQVFNWFRNFRVISGLDDRGYKTFSEKSFEDGTYRNEMIRLVQSLDLGIIDIRSKQLESEKQSDEMAVESPETNRKKSTKQSIDAKVEIQTIHQKFDVQDQPSELITFSLQREESEGTKKLFYLSGPIIDVITNGMILVVDEIEARLHPLLTLALVQLFNSKDTNPKGAQLIFTTHDTNLLSNKYFRRDQIWFIEKDQQGSSHIYSLSDLKERNDLAFEINYIQGRFGAIPFLKNNLNIFCEQINE